MASVLDKIVATKRTEIAAAKAARSEAVLRELAAQAPPPRDFFSPLAAGKPIRLIAEVKKASPSAGVIRADFNPVEIARIYQRHGATCLSVLTDEQYFQGSLDYLRDVRAAVTLPVLRKDFILDSYQLYEARAAGADAVLLIAECLDDCNLRKLHNEAVGAGHEPASGTVRPGEPAARVRRRRHADWREQPRPAHLRHRPGAHACGCAIACPTSACWSAKAASAREPT